MLGGSYRRHYASYPFYHSQLQTLASSHGLLATVASIKIPWLQKPFQRDCISLCCLIYLGKFWSVAHNRARLKKTTNLWNHKASVGNGPWILVVVTPAFFGFSFLTCEISLLLGM